MNKPETKRFFTTEKKLFTGALVLLFLFLSTSFLQAQTQSIDVRTSDEIKALNQQIAEKNQEIEDLTSQADDFADLIAEKQAEERTLQSELAIIDNRVAKTQIDLARKESEIESTNLQIQETNLVIDQKQVQIDFQQTQIAALLREIHRQDQRGQLEILLLNDNLSDYFGYLQQLQDVQASLQSSLTFFQANKRQLEVEQFTLESKKADLQTLALELEIEKQKLEEEKQAKQFLIDETENSEAKFQERLAEIRFQQRIANETISDLENEIKEKLRKAQQQNPEFVLNPGSLLWPIPNQGITTYYNDPSYPYRHVVGEHSGLDIRTLVNGIPTMGLSVKAPAGGVIVRTITNGKFTGNAVFLSHGDIMTVYYHLSAVYVNTDDYVQIGEVFALTGGAPGHPGAGLSSGPHLHFEVRQDGIPVDPCNYLTPSC